jgi:hypothetical protein
MLLAHPHLRAAFFDAIPKEVGDRLAGQNNLGLRLDMA